MSELIDCKVGDFLVASKHEQRSLHEITGETKTQWICGNLRFRKDSGKLVGGDAWSFWATKATPQTIEKIRLFDEHHKIQRKLLEVRVTIENLDDCKQFLKRINQVSQWEAKQ